MSFYDSAVPAYLQILGSVSGLLDKAEAHCKAKNIAPDVILSARLFPDMLNFTKQVQMVCDFATKGCARLTGSEVPNTPDTEKTFDELRQRYSQSREFRQTTDRYISEFERLLDEVSRNERDPSVARSYLSSETGKVYTILAHAAGRFDELV